MRAFQRPVYKQGLEEQPRKPLAIGIQAKCIAVMRVLGNIARKYRCEKQSCYFTNSGAALRHGQYQCAAQRYLCYAGINHGIILV